MKKIVNIIAVILIAGLSCGLGYFYFELQDRNEIIDNLEEEIEDLESKNTSLNKDIEEKNYIIKTYESVIGEDLKNTDKKTNNTEYSNLIKVNFDDVLEMTAKNETFILVATMTSCSHCKSYKPVLNDILKINNINAYEIDLQELTTADHESFNSMFDVSGTPTTLFFIKGKENIENRIVGNQPEQVIREKLINTGFIE